MSAVRTRWLAAAVVVLLVGAVAARLPSGAGGLDGVLAKSGAPLTLSR